MKVGVSRVGVPDGVAVTCVSALIAPCYRAVHMDIAARGHREYWLTGGRGSAKSSFISLEIVLGLLRYPEANAVIYRKVAATLRESVFGQMLWAIDRLGLTAFFRPRLAPLEIEYLPTGQRILSSLLCNFSLILLS